MAPKGKRKGESKQPAASKKAKSPATEKENGAITEKTAVKLLQALASTVDDMPEQHSSRWDKLLSVNGSTISVTNQFHQGEFSTFDEKRNDFRYQSKVGAKIFSAAFSDKARRDMFVSEHAKCALILCLRLGIEASDYSRGFAFLPMLRKITEGEAQRLVSELAKNFEIGLFGQDFDLVEYLEEVGRDSLREYLQLGAKEEDYDEDQDSENEDLGWVKVDGRRGHPCFYVNEATGKAQWEMPDGPIKTESKYDLVPAEVPYKHGMVPGKKRK